VLVGGAGVEVKKDGTGVWAFGRAFGYMLLGFCSLSSFWMLEVVASCVTFWNDENWWVTFWNLILSCDVISGLMGVGDAGVELRKTKATQTTKATQKPNATKGRQQHATATQKPSETENRENKKQKGRSQEAKKPNATQITLKATTTTKIDEKKPQKQGKNNE
jgi:hypothetical protein